jgi:hypothetical protein
MHKLRDLQPVEQEGENMREPSLIEQELSKLAGGANKV